MFSFGHDCLRLVGLFIHIINTSRRLMFLSNAEKRIRDVHGHDKRAHDHVVNGLACRLAHTSKKIRILIIRMGRVAMQALCTNTTTCDYPRFSANKTIKRLNDAA